MKFSEYFDPMSYAQKKALAAAALGSEKKVIYLYHLAAGRRRPSLRIAEQIQVASKGAVPIQDWQIGTAA